MATSAEITALSDCASFSLDGRNWREHEEAHVPDEKLWVRLQAQRNSLTAAVINTANDT